MILFGCKIGVIEGYYRGKKVFSVEAVGEGNQSSHRAKALGNGEVKIEFHPWRQGTLSALSNPNRRKSRRGKRK